MNWSQFCLELLTKLSTYLNSANEGFLDNNVRHTSELTRRVDDWNSLLEKVQELGLLMLPTSISSGQIRDANLSVENDLRVVIQSLSRRMHDLADRLISFKQERLQLQ
jgi:hypothetical protein